jgi:excisionase family DNA binding protein
MCNGVPMEDIDETTVTSATACSLLGVDRSTLVRWVAAGRITPAFKFPGPSGAYLFHRSEVEQLRAERMTAAR